MPDLKQQDRKPEDVKRDLLCAYAAGVLCVAEEDDLDATAKKMLRRIDQIEGLSVALREERNRITIALLSAACFLSAEQQPIYTQQDPESSIKKPFRHISLTDACLRVLKEHSNEWLDKNQIAYMVATGGYAFKSAHATNSVHVTLRRLVQDGYCEAYEGTGSRTTKHRFLKDKDPRPFPL